MGFWPTAVLVIGVVLISLATASGQGAADQNAGMRFKVLSEDGKPIAGAQLLLAQDTGLGPAGRGVASPNNAWSTRVATDASGEATVAEFPRRPIQITASAPGYAALVLRATEPFKQPVYPITLNHGHTVKGTVKNERGEPLANVTVRLEEPISFSGSAARTDLQTATSTDGRWELPAVPEGRYLQTVDIPSASGNWHAAPTPILVAAANDLPPIDIVAHAGVTVQGQVLVPPDVDLSKQNFNVSLRSPISRSWRIPVGPDGHFEITGIPAGALGRIIIFESDTYYPLVTWDNAPAGFQRKTEGNIGFDLVQPAADTYAGLKIEFLKFAKAHGTVVDQNGAPVQNASIFPHPLNRGTSTREDGTYEISIPPRESVRMEVPPGGQSEGASLPNLTAEPEQVIEQNFTVKRSITPTVVYDRFIGGQVVGPDGQNVTNATVYLGNTMMIPDPLANLQRNTQQPPGQRTWTGGTSGPPTVKSFPEGFTFNQLADGTTDIWAFEPSLGWGMARDVKADTRDVQIKLAPRQVPVRLAGQILDSHGQPSVNARVVLFDSSSLNPVQLGETRSDAQGRFALAVTPARNPDPTVRLICLPAGGALAWKWLPLLPDQNLKIELQPDAAVTGRIVDQNQRPVPHAIVQFYYLRHAAYGMMRLTASSSGSAINQISPRTTTDDNGRFELHGFPEGCAARLLVDAAELASVGTYEWSDIRGKREIPDVALRPTLLLEGTVRESRTGRPAPGATIFVRGHPGDDPLRRTITDADGKYRIGASPGAEGSYLDAHTGSGPGELSGAIVVRSDLIAGDVLRGVDLLLTPSLAVRQAAWKADAARNPAPTPSIVVADDADPLSRDQSSYHDTLTFYDPDHKSRAQLNDLNFVMGTGYKRMMAIDPKDKAVVISDAASSKLYRFKSDGTLEWVKENTRANAIALDPETSNIWAAMAADPGAGGDAQILVINSQGQFLNAIPQFAYDIIYSPHDRSFWIATNTVRKLDLDGHVIAQSPIVYSNPIQCLAANSEDGSVWVSESLGSRLSTSSSGVQSYLLRLSPTARPEQQIAIDVVADLAVDPKHNNLWCLSYEGELLRMDLRGEHVQRIPITSASLTLEPATSYLWAAARDGIYRIDPDGRYVWSMPSREPTAKWLQVVP